MIAVLVATVADKDKNAKPEYVFVRMIHHLVLFCTMQIIAMFVATSVALTNCVLKVLVFVPTALQLRHSAQTPAIVVRVELSVALIKSVLRDRVFVMTTHL
jgi:hypothetical protein